MNPMKAADDFSAIAARMRELKAEPASTDTGVVCPQCEGGGWVLASYQSAHPPNLEVCPECLNPEGLPCP